MIEGILLLSALVGILIAYVVVEKLARKYMLPEPKKHYEHRS